MCVATMAVVSTVLGIAGAGISAAGQLETGQYQAQVAENNAKIAEQNAAYSRTAGMEQAATASRKTAADVARIRTGFAANGVDVNTGSAVDVQAGQRETGKLDAETVLNNAELQAYGYTTQAANFKAQAKQDIIGAQFGAAGTLLEGASSIAGKWGDTTPPPAPTNSWTSARAAVYG